MDGWSWRKRKLSTTTPTRAAVRNGGQAEPNPSGQTGRRADEQTTERVLSGAAAAVWQRDSHPNARQIAAESGRSFGAEFAASWSKRQCQRLPKLAQSWPQPHPAIGRGNRQIAKSPNRARARQRSLFFFRFGRRSPGFRTLAQGGFAQGSVGQRSGTPLSAPQHARCHDSSVQRQSIRRPPKKIQFEPCAAGFLDISCKGHRC